MKKFFLVALLGGAEFAADVRQLLANVFAGKNGTVLNLKGIGKLTAEQRKALAGMLNLDSLFRAKKYDILVRLGVVEEFVERGLESELIARYPDYKSELSDETYQQVIDLVGLKALQNYLSERESDYRFFFLHPLGLKALAQKGYCGFIAAHEKAFRRLVKNYPPQFEGVVPKAEYTKLLERVLD